MEEIFAGIVLYNPDIERLKENVEHISGQVSKVVFVNNGSNNTQEIEDYVKKIIILIFILYSFSYACNQPFYSCLKFLPFGIFKQKYNRNMFNCTQESFERI